MITNYARERSVGEVWIDTIDGAKVITVAGNGCKGCAFATSAGGACPGAVYDRHPCSSDDRKDGREVSPKEEIHSLGDSHHPVTTIVENAKYQITDSKGQEYHFFKSSR